MLSFICISVIVCVCVCVNTQTLTIAYFLSAVLEAGVPGDCSGHDPRRLLRSDTPTLPQQAVEAAALAHLLLSGGIRPGPHGPLDLHHWGLLLRARAGKTGGSGLGITGFDVSR